MIASRLLGAGVLALVLSTQMLQAQKAARYREFQLGADMASVSTLTGVSMSEAKTVHLRPAIMRDMEWRRPYTMSGATVAALPDPVQHIVFSFYNDQLFRLVVDYDRQRTEGLTDTDMIEAISALYGPVTTAPTVASALAEDPGKPVARWADGDVTVALYRLSYASGLRLIVTSVPLGALARTAVAEAIRLDDREAPQREIDRQKKEADAQEAIRQKARLANKAAFRP